MEQRIQRIQQHEQTLNAVNELVEELSQSLRKLEELHPALNELMSYYESPQWMQDYEDSNEGNWPSIPAGVLSQDAVYNVWTDLSLCLSKAQKLSFALLKSPQ